MEISDIEIKKEVGSTEKVILRAAEAVFLERGFAKATTTEIANRAGVNHALLHYYFRTKENLFSQVFPSLISGLISSLKEVFEQDVPFFEKIKNGTEAHFDYVINNPQLPFFIINEFLNDEQRLKRGQLMLSPVILEIHKSLEKSIREEVDKGCIREISASHLLYNIIALNASSVIALPLAKNILKISKQEYDIFLQQRKKENVDIIISRLKK